MLILLGGLHHRALPHPANITIPSGVTSRQPKLLLRVDIITLYPSSASISTLPGLIVLPLHGRRRQTNRCHSWPWL
ncbi:hypothetical protein NL676_028492 [Syzygium grande]|nr:hypothetical protein NL676_028492 [Syzygium grande]